MYQLHTLRNQHRIDHTHFLLRSIERIHHLREPGPTSNRDLIVRGVHVHTAQLTHINLEPII